MSYAPAARWPATWWWKFALPAVAIVAALALFALRYPSWGIGGPDLRGVEEYKLPAGVAFPVAIAVAPDRSGVWFTLESSNRLGVLRPDGEFGFVRRRNVDCPPFSAAGGGAFRRSGDDAER